MKYLKSAPFTTGAPPGETYRNNWENTFGKKHCDPVGACESNGRCWTHSDWLEPENIENPEDMVEALGIVFEYSESDERKLQDGIKKVLGATCYACGQKL